MFRAVSLALMLALGGCVVVPDDAPTPVVEEAGISKVELVVPIPASSDVQAVTNTVAWNEARLTLSPLDGGGPAVAYMLEAHDAGLQAVDSLGPMPPGRYSVHAELLAAFSGGPQAVVATGDLTGAQALAIAPGGNDLQVLLHPALAGTHVALVPTSLDPQPRHGWQRSRSNPSDQTDWSDSFAATATVATVLAGALGAAGAESPSRLPSSYDAPPPAELPADSSAARGEFGPPDSPDNGPTDPTAGDGSHGSDSGDSGNNTSDPSTSSSTDDSQDGKP